MNSKIKKILITLFALSAIVVFLVVNYTFINKVKISDTVIYSEIFSINGGLHNIFIEKKSIDSYGGYDLLLKSRGKGSNKDRIVDIIFHDGANPEIHNVFFHNGYLVASFSWFVKNKVENFEVKYYDTYIYDTNLNKIDDLSLFGRGEKYLYLKEESVIKKLKELENKKEN